MINNSEKQLINGRYVQVIATYHDDENNKDYIIYTDETKDDNGKLNVIYGSYILDNGNIVVSKLANGKEEKKVLEILKYAMKS